MPQVSFSILVALSLRPRHGYEIIQQVHEDTQGNVHLAAGTLYGTLDKLRKQKLIKEVGEDAADRRRYYSLTDAGRKRLAAELECLQRLVEIGKSRETAAKQHGGAAYA